MFIRTCVAQLPARGLHLLCFAGQLSGKNVASCCFTFESLALKSHHIWPDYHKILLWYHGSHSKRDRVVQASTPGNKKLEQACAKCGNQRWAWATHQCACTSTPTIERPRQVRSSQTHSWNLASGRRIRILLLLTSIEQKCFANNIVILYLWILGNRKRVSAGLQTR